MSKLPNQSSCLISFILPAYKSRWLKQAIDSILGQTYPNIELVIVNDQSPDNLDEIVCTYTDSRIRYYKNKENIGGKHLTKQWEHCIKYAQGDYLVIAADDDIYHPAFAEECLYIAKTNSDVDIVRARTDQIDENNNLLGVDNCFPHYMSQTEYIFRYREGSTFICMGNFLFKTSALKQKGFVNFPMALGSDIATSIKMAENGMANTEIVLFSFRQSSVHLSGSTSRYKERLAAITQFFDWLMKFNYQAPADRYEAYYLSRLTLQDWHEKCIYDYYNQVIKRLSLRKIHYIRYAKKATARDKSLMIARYIKDCVFG